MMNLSLKVQSDESTKLMRKVASGDIKAFDCLYYKFFPILKCFFATQNGHYTSSDDFIQEVFARLWEQRKNFRGESSFLTYLFSIARYTLNEEIRQSRRIAEIDLKEHLRLNRDSHNDLSQPEKMFYFKELISAFEGARVMLTAQQRQALEVSQSAAIPLCKASIKLGCSHEALKSRLKRARKRLQELLDPILKKE